MQRGSKRSHDDANANALPLRTGQWTQAEIAFAQKVIQYFHLGTLPNCENGATLRARQIGRRSGPRCWTGGRRTGR